MATAVQTRIRVCADRELRATRVDAERGIHQLVTFDGRSRFHAVSVNGPRAGEAVFTIGRGRTFAARVTQIASTGRIATSWAARTTSESTLSGSADANFAGTVKEWEQTWQYKDGGSLTQHFTDNGDGSTTRVDTSRDAGNAVTGQSVTNSTKTSRDSVTYDAEGNPTRQETERPAANGVNGTDSRITQYENGVATLETVTHTEYGVDDRGNVTTTTHSEQTGGGIGGSDTITADTVQQGGSFSGHSLETNTNTGDTTERTIVQRGGHTETHEVQKDGQGNVTGSNDVISDSWTDRDGNHTVQDIHGDNQHSTSDTHVEKTEHSDGSTETSTESTTTNKDTGETTTTRSDDVKDSQGNESTTTVTQHDDGSSTVTTTTTDSNGDGTEHTTEIDANGEVTSDTTTDVHRSDSDSGSMGWEGGDEGPSITQYVARAQAWVEQQRLLQHDGETDEELAPLQTAQLREHLKTVVIDDHSSLGWGDASSEEPPTPDLSKVELDDPPTATDDWGDLNNPRALVAVTERLLVAAGRVMVTRPDDAAVVAERLLRNT